MIFTFSINTTDSHKLKEQIETYLEKHNLCLPKEDIQKLAYYIHDKSYMYVDKVCANNEDSAFDKVDDTRVIEELEITEVDYSDKQEAEEHARAIYEAQQEDIAMERAKGII